MGLCVYTQSFPSSVPLKGPGGSNTPEQPVSAQKLVFKRRSPLKEPDLLRETADSGLGQRHTK